MGIYQANIYSEALGMYTELHAYLPQDEPAGRKRGKPATLILLHGITGDATSWLRRTKLEAIVEKYNLAVFMPSGARSFYHNLGDGPEYLTYIGKELPEIIAKSFNVATDRDNLFIAGLSMGGHGAMLAGLSYPKTFSKVGAFSGLYQINDYRIEHKNDPIDRNALKVRADLRIAFGDDLERIESGDLHKLFNRFPNKSELPQMFITCGTNDILLGQSRAFHECLSAVKFPHTYLEWEGNHEWDFWGISLKRMLEAFFEGVK